jgi:hypothetical protein
MVRFGIPDCPIFLPSLLLDGTSVTAISCVVASMDRTTPSKVDTSSAEAPKAQALVTQLGSKTPDDAPIDDYLNLLNSTTAVS